MSEAIIAKRYSKSSSSGGPGTEPSHLVTEVIVENTNWTVPSGINGNKVSVRLFGGGGGGGNGSHNGGGGGGWMNNADIVVEEGQVISIRIGKGGRYSHSGGTTSFGTYLSASGGSAPNSTDAGSGGSGGGGYQKNGGTGYQFGGGGSAARYINSDKSFKAGDGGPWGGGGGYGHGTNPTGIHTLVNGIGYYLCDLGDTQSNSYQYGSKPGICIIQYYTRD